MLCELSVTVSCISEDTWDVPRSSDNADRDLSTVRNEQLLDILHRDITKIRYRDLTLLLASQHKQM
jgi:hypothetical protein